MYDISNVSWFLLQIRVNSYSFLFVNTFTAPPLKKESSTKDLAVKSFDNVVNTLAHYFFSTFY